MSRVALLSDTHMRHDRVTLPACDLLVHCGDATRHGTRGEMVAFLDWFGRQAAPAKVLIGGNHDAFCEHEADIVRRLAAELGVTWLLDEAVTLCGLRLWGSPVTPAFRSMAFNRERGAEIRAHWDRIPDGLDLLITHGPPRGMGDRVFFGAHVGCVDLLGAVRRARPRVHVFGHIHEAAGEYRLDGLATRFLNVATSRLLVGKVREVPVLDL